jgi:hypothetical protein
MSLINTGHDLGPSDQEKFVIQVYANKGHVPFKRQRKVSHINFQNHYFEICSLLIFYMAKSEQCSLKLRNTNLALKTEGNKFY